MQSLCGPAYRAGKDQESMGYAKCIIGAANGRRSRALERIGWVLPLLALLAAAGPPAAAAGKKKSDPSGAPVQKPKGQKARPFKVGGALRLQYVLRDWNPDSRNQGGTLDFDTFRLNIDGRYKGIILAAEYRFYDGWNALKSGWMGYNFTPDWQGRFGLLRIPFGILPYASHSYFFSSNYYLGLEDTYEAGIKMLYRRPGSPWDLRIAFFKNAGFGLYGHGDPGRYSFNAVTASSTARGGDPAQQNAGDNALAGRVAYTFGGAGNTTEVGASVLAGQLYNYATQENGSRWAAGVHVNGNYGRWNVMAEFLHYAYHPRNPPGVDGNVIQLGAYDYYYPIPASGDSAVFNLAYTLPVHWGPVSSLKFYNDYTEIFRKQGGFPVTRMNIFGTGIKAGKVYVYVDLVTAENQPFIGGLIAPGPTSDRSWNTRFNVNVGYYF